MQAAEAHTAIRNRGKKICKQINNQLKYKTIMGTTKFIKNKLQLQFIKCLDVEQCKKENCRTFGSGKGCEPKPGIVCGTNKVNENLEDIAKIEDISERLKKLVAYYNEYRTKYFLACLKQKCSLGDCVTSCHIEGEQVYFHSHIWGNHYTAVKKVALEQIENLEWDEDINTFEDLYGYLKKNLCQNGDEHANGYGRLTLYDTAIRIGYHVMKNGKLHPIMPEEYVYMQSGALVGARKLTKLGFSKACAPKITPVQKFFDLYPGVFEGLKTKEGKSTTALLLEDFLCVMEKYIG
jgi:hypothetical protein